MKKTIWMIILAITLFANSALALSVNLQWDANTETDLAGYKLYYSEVSATPFAGTGATEGATPIDVGKVTTTTVSGLDAAKDWYFAVTAYNTSNLESSYSNIVSVLRFPTVTASAGAGGSISPIGATTVASGQSLSYTITPSSACYRSNVFVDGTALGPLSTYSFTSLSSNHTINATFALIPFTINASAGTGGTISNAGYSVASCGASPVFTITPDSGFRIVDVTDNGVSKGAVSSLTISNISGNHTLVATFATTVVVGASAGGTATPLGTNLVPFGGSLSLTLTPNTGFFVNSVLLDGTPLTVSSNKVTLASITGPHTLSIGFGNLALVSKVGTFLNGTWYLDMNGNGIFESVADKAIPDFGKGIAGAIPVTGDWNGSGTTKVGVFVNGTWYLDMNGNGIFESVADKAIPDFGKVLNTRPISGKW